MSGMIEHQSVAFRFVVAAGEKRYGYVRYPSGRMGMRNYHRELKNGKGLSLTDILRDKVIFAENAMLKNLNESMYQIAECGGVDGVRWCAGAGC